MDFSVTSEAEIGIWSGMLGSWLASRKYECNESAIQLIKILNSDTAEVQPVA
jgi:hypothetical protein